MPELQVIARHTMAAGKEEELLALYLKLIAASRQEAGNVSFVAYRQLDEDREIVLLERYASRKAFEEHRATPHFKELVVGQIIPRLEKRTIEKFDAEDSPQS
jgi:quinol monooxygenase YgiN